MPAIPQTSPCPSNEQLSTAMRESSKAWVQALSAGLGRVNLTVLQWAVLECVLESPGLAQTAIAQQVGTDTASLVRLLDGLEKAHWVQRRPCPGDRRVNLVWPHDEAGPRVAQARAALEEVYDRAFSPMGESNKAVLLGLVEQLTRALK
jgi:DNA-binding MarR family transcriptional regulator